MKTPCVGMRTQWGDAQEIEKLAEGLYFASTASHGGFWVSPDKAKEARPGYLRPKTRWYEEDCESLRVMLAFPQHFPRVNDWEAVKKAYDYWHNGVSI